MGIELQRMRALGIYLSYSSNLAPVAWIEGELIDALFQARIYATALGEGSAGYSTHSQRVGMVLDDAVTPTLALTSIHTMASLGLGRPSTRPQRVLDGPSYFGYSFVVQQPGSAPTIGDPGDAGSDSDPRSSAAANGTAAVVLALWSRDAEYASSKQVHVTLPPKQGQQTDDVGGVSAINQFGNSMAVALNSTTLEFSIGRELMYLIFRSSDTRTLSRIADIVESVANTLVMLDPNPSPTRQASTSWW